MSTAIERFVRFHKHLQLTELYPGRNVLEERLGVSNGYITKTFSKKSSIGSDLIERISKLFPNLNILWLITGEGNMLNDENQFITSDSNEGNVELQDMVLKLQEELREAYMEIGKLNMELKSAQEHKLISKRG